VKKVLVWVENPPPDHPICLSKTQDFAGEPLLPMINNKKKAKELIAPLL
jgi:hypothetical protein